MAIDSIEKKNRAIKLRTGDAATLAGHHPAHRLRAGVGRNRGRRTDRPAARA